jgi:hypothetical protein
MRPLALNKKQAVAALGSSKLVARMLWASRYAWRSVANFRFRQGRDLLIDTASVESAYKRLLQGEQPPLMPSERRAHSSGANIAAT